jgi:energy-coupling factor transport system ATP-binding protein
MIDVVAMTYTYPATSRPAIRDLTLRVDRGELTLLAGRSGSGKSTLLSAINGLVPHFYGGRFRGRVMVAGMDTRRARPVDIAGRVGTVFQEPGARFVTNGVQDEIALGMELAGLPSEEIGRRVREIVERLELGPLLERPLDRLSGGEQQRVALAAALSREPEVLLLDEPTSQLDTQSAEAVLQWVVRLNEQLGLTALVSEHRLGRLLPWVNRMIFLAEGGTLAAAGLPSQVLPRMPYGPPVVEAARRLGMEMPTDAEAAHALRDRLRALASEARLRRAKGTGEPLLRARGLSYAYDGILALQEADLDVSAGETVAVMGRNGSGKTTLLRCLMGLLRPQCGEVRLRGEPLNGRPVAEIARSIAYVPQWPSALLFAESVRAELDFTLRNLGLLAHPPISPEALLKRLDLEDLADRYPRDLSSGERQRTALAAVLVTRPGVVLLDEPTLGMDPVAQAHFGLLIEGWQAEGMAVLVATHDVEFAAAHAERVVILDRGRVRVAGPAAETLFSQPELRTGLQQWVGQAHPASPADLPQAAGREGLEHADG